MKVILPIIIMGIGGLLLYFVLLHSSLIDIAENSLAKQMSYETTAVGNKVTVNFQQSEYVNIAIAECRWFSVKRQDLNKSKIVGEYIGEKSKEFMFGFFKGRKKKSKHGVNQ